MQGRAGSAAEQAARSRDARRDAACFAVSHRLTDKDIKMAGGVHQTGNSKTVHNQVSLSDGPHNDLVRQRALSAFQCLRSVSALRLSDTPDRRQLKKAASRWAEYHSVSHLQRVHPPWSRTGVLSHARRSGLVELVQRCEQPVKQRLRTRGVPWLKSR